MAYTDNFDVSALSGYVQENKFDLLGRSILSTELAQNITLKPGLQGDVAKITLMADNFQVGAQACGWNPTGETTLTQVSMNLFHAEFSHSYCLKDLRSTWMAETLRPGAQAGLESLPYEQVYAEYFVKSLKKYNEKYLIQGETNYPGIQAQLVGATAGTGHEVVTGENNDKKWVSGTAGANEVNAFTGAMKMFEKMPFELALRDDLILVVNQSDFKALVVALVEKNLYHYTGSVEKIIVPGTNITVIPTSGITQESDGRNFRFLTAGNNIILGTDLMSDHESFDIWYSQDNREVRAAMAWTIGVAVVEPDMVVAENFA